MDAWEILVSNTTTGDAWTRLNELLAILPGKHVVQATLVTGQVQQVVVAIPFTQTVVPVEVATVSIKPLNPITVSAEQSTWQLSA